MQTGAEYAAVTQLVSNSHLPSKHVGHSSQLWSLFTSQELEVLPMTLEPQLDA